MWGRGYVGPIYQLLRTLTQNIGAKTYVELESDGHDQKPERTKTPNKSFTKSTQLITLSERKDGRYER